MLSVVDLVNFLFWLFEEEEEDGLGDLGGWVVAVCGGVGVAAFAGDDDILVRLCCGESVCGVDVFFKLNFIKIYSSMVK